MGTKESENELTIMRILNSISDDVRYIGVAPVTIVAVNPNKELLENIYDTTLDETPEYTGSQNSNGKEVPFARIDFIVKTDPEKSNGIEMITKVSYFIRQRYRYNKDMSKVQVIDKYGRTAWVTNQQAETHEIPIYVNGPANIDRDYRPCFVGEEELTNFVKTYLQIPCVQKYVDGKWELVDNPEECEARFNLGSILKFFEGDFEELKEVMGYQPNNKVKIMFGIRTSDDGRQYQTAYTQMVLRSGVTDYSKIKEDLQKRKAAGAYTNSFFEATPLHELIIH